MVLLFDVGNTNIVMGIVKENKIINTYRFITNSNMTEDEYYSKFQSVIGTNEIEGIAISSVVPLVDHTLITMSRKYFNITPLIVGPGIKSGVKIKIENPKQLGADLLCDAVGAKLYFKDTCVIVDLGTATKFIVINKNNEFLGGAISPGIMTSFNNMINSAAKLSNTGVAKPTKVIGNDTQTCIQSGLINGFASMIDGMIKKIKAELNEEVKVILTGGLAPTVDTVLETEFVYMPDILLEGLLSIYNKNK